MAPFALARWILVEHARRPGTWAALALCAAAWPAVLTFAELGITTRDEPFSGHFYEIAFLATLFGTALGVDTLARSSWFLERASTTRRMLAEAGGLLGSVLLPLLAASAPALAFASEASGASAGAPALGLMVAHLVALGLLALRLPSPPAVRGLLVPLLAWVVPGLLAGPAQADGGPLADFARWALPLFDASGHGELSAANAGAPSLGLELSPELAHRWGAWLPITAVVAAAWLLADRAPAVHALRNPR